MPQSKERPDPAAGRNLILTGFMGTGKTAVGEILARRLGRRFVDTDALVEEKTGLSIPEIFARFGEEYFRDRESEAVASLERHPPGSLVVATGGGAVLRERNRESLARHGFIILLTATPAAILRRTRRDHHRPLLQGAPAPRQAVQVLLAQREPFYRHHHLKVDTTGRRPDRVAAAIINALVKKGARHQRQELTGRQGNVKRGR